MGNTEEGKIQKIAPLYFQTPLYNKRKSWSSSFSKEIQEIGPSGEKSTDNSKITLRSLQKLPRSLAFKNSYFGLREWTTSQTYLIFQGMSHTENRSNIAVLI